MTYVVHPWPPVFDETARVLILGTMPSPKSLEAKFYYGHPQNVFWKTMAAVLGDETPASGPQAREAFLLKHHVAVWDVLKACEIDGARDDRIRNAEVNIFRPLIDRTEIQKIFTTGKKATTLFNRYCAAEAGMKAIYLPSTSPANRGRQSRPEFAALWAQVGEALCQ
ncbi:MAG: DNA-deoxyinosine glycosylase [Clostridiales Family XIII bacterium]|jgi:hypoxanthine-DNA glycosylase|nr:DNA-deoxyinosine glycosylase [Clostridiales Family XIII bacterium]